MAVSKKRKVRGKAVKRQVVEVPAREPSTQWNVKIKASRLIELRDDPDFLTMVKFGRAINALTFAMTVAGASMQATSYIGRRQYRRGIFVLAGYLHQTIQLVRGIGAGDRHISMESFIPLRTIAHDVKYKKVRNYCKTIRNYTAFHLDEFDEHENTRNSLAKLEAGAHVMMGADDDNYITFYFELADYLDFSLVGKTFQGDQTPEEIMNDITLSIFQLAGEMLDALFQFEIALTRKMELHEYVYGNDPSRR